MSYTHNIRSLKSSTTNTQTNKNKLFIPMRKLYVELTYWLTLIFLRFFFTLCCCFVYTIKNGWWFHSPFGMQLTLLFHGKSIFQSWKLSLWWFVFFLCRLFIGKTFEFFFCSLSAVPSIYIQFAFVWKLILFIKTNKFHIENVLKNMHKYGTLFTVYNHINLTNLS